MDGTLVDSPLDFAFVRRELGIGPKEDILEAIDAMPAERAQRAKQWLEDYELSAAEQAELMPHAAETVQSVREAGLKTALLTRNDGVTMRKILNTFAGLDFDIAWSRHDHRIKPEPHGVLAACEALEVSPARTISIGDYRYDLMAANAAGAVSVLYAPRTLPPFAHEADHVIGGLDELLPLLGVDGSGCS